MAINELLTSGKWATNGNWSLAVKPTAAHDVKIPAGKEVKIEAAAECRSLYGETTCKITGASELKIGNAEKPEGPAGNSWALKVDSEATITTWTSNVILLSTAAETQKIAVGPTAKWNELRLKEKSTAKYVLEAALTFAAEGLKLQSETSFDSNGFALKIEKLSSVGSTKVTLKLGTSTVTITGNLFEAPGAESTVTATSSTIVLEGANGTFSGGGFSYGTVTIAGMKWTVSGNNTISTLNVNNKGAAAGEGFRLSKGMNLTVTTLTTNGTEASQTRLETNEAGKTATLTIGEQELASWLKLKDITVPVGVWYLPKGTDEGGNVTVGTTIKFEAKPSGAKTFAATATISINPTVTPKMLASTAATAGATSAPKLTDQMTSAFAGHAGTTLTAKTSDAMLAAFAAKAGITVMPKGTFRIITAEGKRVLILILDE